MTPRQRLEYVLQRLMVAVNVSMTRRQCPCCGASHAESDSAPAEGDCPLFDFNVAWSEFRQRADWSQLVRSVLIPGSETGIVLTPALIAAHEVIQELHAELCTCDNDRCAVCQLWRFWESTQSCRSLLIARLSAPAGDMAALCASFERIARAHMYGPRIPCPNCHALGSHVVVDAINQTVQATRCATCDGEGTCRHPRDDLVRRLRWLNQRSLRASCLSSEETTLLTTALDRLYALSQAPVAATPPVDASEPEPEATPPEPVPAKSLDPDTVETLRRVATNVGSAKLRLSSALVALRKLQLPEE